MRKFEYKAMPAPHQGKKARGVKTTGDRFALSMTDALNEMAEEGWEYVRAETLPCDERKGLTGTQTTYQNILIFRRLEAAVETLTLETAPRSVTAPVHDDPVEDFATPPETPEAPVSPRPVTLDQIGEGTPPPLGSARDD
jgi:hypothetical protein